MNTRFIESIVRTANETTVAMPWERGANRVATLDARKSPHAGMKSA